MVGFTVVEVGTVSIGCVLYTTCCCRSSVDTVQHQFLVIIADS